MEATELSHGDPISATAWRFLYLHSHHSNPNTMIFSYFLAKGALPKSVTSTHIVSLLHLHPASICFQRLGFFPHYIGSHSLLSGGSMELHQAHIPNSTINIIIWWRSDTFLIYLQVQVATFTKDVASAMAKIAWFYHQVAPLLPPCGSHLIIFQKTPHQRPTITPIPKFPTKSTFQFPKPGLINQSPNKTPSTYLIRVPYGYFQGTPPPPC